MEKKRSAFQNDQRAILRDLKKRGHLQLGQLGRKGSKVQHLVESIRGLKVGTQIFPASLAARGYAPLTVHQALTRMEMVGEIKRLRQGAYKRRANSDFNIDERDDNA